MSEQVIYAKASAERKPEFRQQTLIIRKDGELLARKIPVGPQAAAHIRQYSAHYETLAQALKDARAVSAVPCTLNPDGSADFPYLCEPTLQEKLAGKTPEEYGRLLTVFRDILTEALGSTVFEPTDAFDGIYGEVCLPEGLTALKVTVADLNFDNVFCREDGSYTLIDYEWVFPFPVPLAYLLFRSLLLDPAYTSWTETEQETVLSMLGIDEAMRTVFRQMEASFLEWVSPEQYRMDYFARVPGARHNMIHELDRLTALPEENRILEEEKDRISLYTGRWWFRLFRRTDDLLRKGRGAVRRFARKDNLAGCICTWLVVCFREGPSAARDKVIRPRRRKKAEKKYAAGLFRQAGTEIQNEPETVKFSVLVPLYNTPLPFLKEMIASVQGQYYQNWELCLADGSDETHRDVGKICLALSEQDPRIRYLKLPENRGISENTNACIDMAAGDYLALFDHDDLLHPAALSEMAKAIREQGADFLYSDEIVFESPDKTNVISTHFKPDYAPESLRANNYICHLTVFRASLTEQAGRFRSECNGSQDYDMILRLTDCAQKVVHIPKPLYFWRSHPASTASSIGTKTYAVEAGKRALEDFFRNRKQMETEVESTPECPTMYHVRYPVRKTDRVSLVMDLSGRTEEQISRIVSGICGNTGYRRFTLTALTDEASGKDTGGYPVRRIRSSAAGKAERLNDAVRQTEGEMLVFLDPALIPQRRDWLSEMLMLAQQEEIGAVGGKSLFTNGTIRHGGLILGFGSKRLAGRSHYGIRADSAGYFGQMSMVENVSALSAECMMVSREKFDACGGFDPAYAGVLYDADLCLKLRQAGYRNVFTPFALFRGGEAKDSPRDYGTESASYRTDAERFRTKWNQELNRPDPYYNPNLTLDRNDFSIGRQAF